MQHVLFIPFKPPDSLAFGARKARPSKAPLSILPPGDTIPITLDSYMRSRGLSPGYQRLMAQVFKTHRRMEDHLRQYCWSKLSATLSEEQRTRLANSPPYDLLIRLGTDLCKPTLGTLRHMGKIKQFLLFEDLKPILPQLGGTRTRLIGIGNETIAFRIPRQPSVTRIRQIKEFRPEFHLDPRIKDCFWPLKTVSCFEDRGNFFVIEQQPFIQRSEDITPQEKGGLTRRLQAAGYEPIDNYWFNYGFQSIPNSRQSGKKREVRFFDVGCVRRRRQSA